MGVTPKASLVITLALPRLFIEGVSWVCEWLLAVECRGNMKFGPLANTGIEKVDFKKKGAKEVLDLFLSHDIEDDDIFVRLMAWGTLILMFALWWIKQFDVVYAVP